MNTQIHRISRKARRFSNRNRSLQRKPASFIENADKAGRFLKEYENVLLPDMAFAINPPVKGIIYHPEGDNFMKKIKNVLLAVAASAVALVSTGASAAVSTEVTSAITTAGTDGATIGSAVLVVIVGIVSFKYLRRAL